VYTEIVMITRVFKSGNSRAVRIPKEFELELGEVIIEQRGREVVIRPKPKTMESAFHLLASLGPDFMKDGREQLPLQERPELDFDALSAGHQHLRVHHELPPALRAGQIPAAPKRRVRDVGGDLR
jgi:antitoxin VapB